MVLDVSAVELTSEFIAVAAVTDVPPGWVLRVTAGAREIALANENGTFHAIDNACSHAAGPLGNNRLQSGCLVECPWHNSVFDVRSGEVVRGPARKPQRTYPVKVTDGVVYVAPNADSQVSLPTSDEED